jgi:hypothetical protein
MWKFLKPVVLAFAALVVSLMPVVGPTHFTAVETTEYVSAGTYVEAGSDVVATESISAGAWLYITAQSFAVADGLPITPTGSYVRLSATSAVTASATTAIYSGTFAGQMIILENTVTHVIVLPDSANTQASGATSLGQHDTWAGMWNGADWIEVSQADN